MSRPKLGEKGAFEPKTIQHIQEQHRQAKTADLSPTKHENFRGTDKGRVELTARSAHKLNTVASASVPVTKRTKYRRYKQSEPGVNVVTPSAPKSVFGRKDGENLAEVMRKALHIKEDDNNDDSDEYESSSDDESVAAVDDRDPSKMRLPRRESTASARAEAARSHLERRQKNAERVAKIRQSGSEGRRQYVLLSVKVNFLKFCDWWLGPASSRHSRQVFRSERSIRTEQRRQRKQNRFLIHPFSRFRICWDVLVLCALLITLIALPIDIAFYTQPHVHGDHGNGHGDEPGSGHGESAADGGQGEPIDGHGAGEAAASAGDHAEGAAVPQHMNSEGEHPGNDSELDARRSQFDNERKNFYIVSLTCEAFFIMDIVLEFRTGYIDEETEEVIMYNKMIAMEYLKTWFIVDVISIIPIDEIYEGAQPGDVSNYLIFRAFRLTKVLCLLRAFRAMRYLKVIEMYFLMNATFMRLVNVTIVMMLFAHWSGCLQYTIASVVWFPNFPPDSWVAAANLTGSDVPVYYKYIQSVFRAISQMIACGYGQSTPILTVETWVVVINIMIGCTLIGLFLAMIAKLLSSIDASGRKYNQLLTELREFMRFCKVPSPVQRKCVEYFEQKYRKKYFNEPKFIRSSLISPPLRRQIALHNCRDLIANVDLFKGTSDDFVYDVISRLEFQVYFPGDFFVYAGRHPIGLHFILHGRVEYRAPGEQTALDVLDEGRYFGVYSLLTDSKSLHDIVATDYCDVYILSRDSFEEVLNDYPETKQIIGRALRTLSKSS